MSHPRSIRVATYNVHGCVGTDGIRSVERISDVLAGCQADVIGLQEIDVGRTRSDHLDQAEAIAVRLGMTHCFGAALHDGVGHYGNAIMSRHPVHHVRTEKLPGLRISEPRCYVHARITIDDPSGARAGVHDSVEIDAVVTHFGLGPFERILQARWVAEEVERTLSHAILLGDLNTTRFSVAYACLSSKLRDAQRLLAPRDARATYPSWRPFLRLDHVFLGPEWDVLNVCVPDGDVARTASDHRPLVVTVAAREARDMNAPGEASSLKSRASLSTIGR